MFASQPTNSKAVNASGSRDLSITIAALPPALHLASLLDPSVCGHFGGHASRVAIDWVQMQR
jgi:hypothetical protein